MRRQALTKFEAKRDVWQEVLDGVQEIKASKGKQTNIEAKSYVVRVQFTTQLYSDPYSSSSLCAKNFRG
ncbi:MAG: hypothetical protein CV089_19410 [Nitrospira sp. WS110]|nr:hypothetical protein [Nitrospira sp. WS110]